MIDAEADFYRQHNANAHRGIYLLAEETTAPILFGRSNPVVFGAAAGFLFWLVAAILYVKRRRLLPFLILDVVGTLAFLGVFGLVALLLSAVGILGIVSQVVASRMHEFGIRAALGATRATRLRMESEQLIQRINLHLALGGSFEPRPLPAVAGALL